MDAQVGCEGVVVRRTSRRVQALGATGVLLLGTAGLVGCTQEVACPAVAMVGTLAVRLRDLPPAAGLTAQACRDGWCATSLAPGDGGSTLVVYLGGLQAASTSPGPSPSALFGADAQELEITVGTTAPGSSQTGPPRIARPLVGPVRVRVQPRLVQGGTAQCPQSAYTAVVEASPAGVRQVFDGT